jgi:hypothetical protein
MSGPKIIAEILNNQSRPLETQLTTGFAPAFPGTPAGADGCSLGLWFLNFKLFSA